MPKGFRQFSQDCEYSSAFVNASFLEIDRILGECPKTGFLFSLYSCIMEETKKTDIGLLVVDNRKGMWTPMSQSSFLFQKTISDWDTWGEVFQSIPTFEHLAAGIFKQETLPFQKLSSCTPGTNAVFVSGNRILKIFAPIESGVDSEPDYQTELFGLTRANESGIAAPHLLAHGSFTDRYVFLYLIMERIPGKRFAESRTSMTPGQKFAFGKQLRSVCDKMNTSCPSFNTRNWQDMGNQNHRWDRYTESFLKERAQFVSEYTSETVVYVHGDLNEDNILMDGQNNPQLIDFADALLAPPVYEYALIASDLFQFEAPFLNGFFGDFNLVDMTELCLSGLLLHEFGGSILAQFVEDAPQLPSIEALRAQLFRYIQSELLKK